MPEDLPIYPDATLRSGIQFMDLLRFKSMDTLPIWKKSDGLIAEMEGAASVAEARAMLTVPSVESLCKAHAAMFSGRPGAGGLRQSSIAARFRGQDCPEPEFIERSLQNFFKWMDAESIAEIHPIERAALVMTRITDIWPFEIGNFTMAVVLANAYLNIAGLPPFFLQPGKLSEFEKMMAQAVMIETQPLVNAIHARIKKELERLAA